MFSTNIIFFTTEGKGYQTGIPQGRDAAKIFFWNCSILTFQQNEAIFESILDAPEATVYWIERRLFVLIQPGLIPETSKCIFPFW